MTDHDSMFSAHSLDETRGFQSADGERDYCAGELVGPYNLRQLVAKGGMGEVWLAEQFEPLHRFVALKLIRSDNIRGSKHEVEELVSRFEAERQSLAVMDHPNIAKVLDAGVTQRHHPYFTMEFVQGDNATRQLEDDECSPSPDDPRDKLVSAPSLTGYCDQHRLSLKERLELFIPICRAVQHAHQKQIIHRDIKPSNILVAHSDEAPIPKVIDFGLSKATESQSSSSSANLRKTQAGQVMGTPLYMSPEQADSEHTDIDARTDIYSLGAVLFELLTGLTPLQLDSVAHLTAQEKMDFIRDEPRPLASKRLSSSHHEAISKAATNRQTKSNRLLNRLRGDLDCIVKRALESNREDRYSSAVALAEDIERFLASKPVEAHPTTTGYQVRKFVRRHYGYVASAISIAGILLASTIAIGFLYNRASSSALENKQLSNRFQSVVDLIVGTFELGNPVEEEVEGDVSARDLLSAAFDRVLKGKSQQDPLVSAEMCLAIGNSLHALGDTTTAERAFELCHELRLANLPSAHSDVVDAANHLGIARRMNGQPEQALDVVREFTKTPPSRSDGLFVLRSHEVVAQCYGDTGQDEEAIELYDGILSSLRGRQGPEAAYQRLEATSNLGAIQMQVGNKAEALQLFQEAAAIDDDELYDRHPSVLRVKQNLAYTLFKQGQTEQAIPILEEVLQAREEKLPDSHSDTYLGRVHLADGYEALKRYEEAAVQRERIFKQDRKTFGVAHEKTALALNNLATCYFRMNELDKAAEHLEQATTIARTVNGSDSKEALQFIANLAMIYYKAERYEQALPLYKQLFEARKTFWAANDLGHVYKQLGTLGENLPIIEDHLFRCSKNPDSQPFQRKQSTLLLGLAYRELEQHDDALPYLLRSGQFKEAAASALDIRSDPTFSDDAELLSLARIASAEALLAAESLEDGLVQVNEMVTEATDPIEAIHATSLKAAFLLAQEKHDDALVLADKSVEQFSALLPEKHKSLTFQWSARLAIKRLANLQKARGEEETAEQALKALSDFDAKSKELRNSSASRLFKYLLPSRE